MKNKLPGITMDVNNGKVSLIFQTTSHKGVLRFENESLVFEVDGVLVWSAEKV